MAHEPVIVRLKRGRERPVMHGHPWIFSGAIEEVTGQSVVGDIADVISHDGQWLARGLIHPDASLTVRLYTRRKEQALDALFFATRAEKALVFRKRLLNPESLWQTNAYRLIYSESDGLSGLIVDRYADTLSVQVSAKALLPFLDVILERLRGLTGIGNIYVAAGEDSVEREKTRHFCPTGGFS